jgi:TRAP-type C4-dicarboxylate transport system permease small subunit
MQNAILKTFRFIEKKMVPGIAVCFFGFSVTWMLVEALSRQIFERSFAVSEELIVFSLLWAIFLILPDSGRSGFHIYVDLFINKASKKFKRIVNTLTALLSATYCIVIVISSYGFIRHLYRMQIISESPLQLPMWAIYMAILAGAVFMALFYLERAVLSFRDRGN